jgi:hypothetical protein
MTAPTGDQTVADAATIAIEKGEGK